MSVLPLPPVLCKDCPVGEGEGGGVGEGEGGGVMMGIRICDMGSGLVMGMW